MADRVSEPEPLLVVRGLTLLFGGLRALDTVDLDVAEGTITGLIGPNGAGKTSLLNAICRFYRPQRGEIEFDGEDLLRHPAHDLPGLGVARTFQQVELFRTMSSVENVLVGAHTGQRPGALAEALRLPLARRAARRQYELALETLECVGLRHLADHPVRALPLGLQKRVGIARALASRPRLLLLDEPAGGLNTPEKRELASLLRALRERLRLTMLLIEHDMDLVMGLCESITVLDFGKRIAAGPPDTVQRHPAVVAAYLGVASAQSGDEADRVPDRGVDSSVSSNVHVPSSTSSNWRPLTETAPSHTHHQAWNRTTHRAGPGRPEPLLEVHGLRVVYGQVPAVHNLSLRVEEGQAVAILGANGAGKSSTLRTIGGLQRPQAGRILFEGTRIDHRSTPELVDRGICLVPDTKDLFPRFTVEENLRMGVGRRASRDYPVLRDGVLELFPLLRRRLNAPAWQLSGGERQMLALGRALVAQPRLLLLDEPSLGLAPLAVEAIFQALATIVARGTAVLLVEQSTAAALRLADFAYVLRTGHLALAGPSANLLHDPHVVDLYLGGEVHGSPVS